MVGLPWINKEIEEQNTKIIEQDATITDEFGYIYPRSEYICGVCGNRVIGNNKYCPHCGTKLNWNKIVKRKDF